jgi:hypothetical protein
MAIDEQERINAVNRYTRGDKPADICRDVNMSKKWLTGFGKSHKSEYLWVGADAGPIYDE